MAESNSVISGQNSSVNCDPLFISNSDNPNSSLVPSIFSGSNFVRWSRSIFRALGAKNKEVFINGELLEPDASDKDHSRWKRADYMVMSWILSSMTSDITDDFAYAESSQELWKQLHERFGQSTGPLIYQLKKDISALRQENMTILAYYGKIKRMWDEIQSLHSLPVCTCGVLKNCTCEFLKKASRF